LNPLLDAWVLDARAGKAAVAQIGRGLCGYDILMLSASQLGTTSRAWLSCPKCQGAAAKGWLAARVADLLPVGYFHLVFTLPA
jgi:Transposase zinc-binding domain